MYRKIVIINVIIAFLSSAIVPPIHGGAGDPSRNSLAPESDFSKNNNGKGLIQTLEEKKREKDEKLSARLASPIAETDVAKIESFQVKAPFHTDRSFKNKGDTAPLKFASPDEAYDFGAKLPHVVRHDVDVNGTKVEVLLEKDIADAFPFLTETMIGNLLKEALDRSGGKIGTLPKNKAGNHFLVISNLYSSSHLLEDHIANGFIGINRALYEIKDDNVRALLLQVGLFHEICHELTGEEGNDFENAQILKDALFALKLIMRKTVTVNVGKMETLIYRYLEKQAGKFINFISEANNAVMSIKMMLGASRPDIMQPYAQLNNLSDPDKEKLLNAIYAIQPQDFINMKLGDALDTKQMPVFEGSVIEALIATFPNLDLRREKFAAYTPPVVVAKAETQASTPAKARKRRKPADLPEGKEALPVKEAAVAPLSDEQLWQSTRLLLILNESIKGEGKPEAKSEALIDLALKCFSSGLKNVSIYVLEQALIAAKEIRNFADSHPQEDMKKKIAMAFVDIGEVERAKKVAPRGSKRIFGGIAIAVAKKGDKDKALEIMDQSGRFDPRAKLYTKVDIALALAEAGKAEEGIELIEKECVPYVNDLGECRNVLIALTRMGKIDKANNVLRNIRIYDNHFLIDLSDKIDKEIGDVLSSIITKRTISLHANASSFFPFSELKEVKQLYKDGKKEEGLILLVKTIERLIMRQKAYKGLWTLQELNELKMYISHDGVFDPCLPDIIMSDLLKQAEKLRRILRQEQHPLPFNDAEIQELRMLPVASFETGAQSEEYKLWNASVPDSRFPEEFFADIADAGSFRKLLSRLQELRQAGFVPAPNLLKSALPVEILKKMSADIKQGNFDPNDKLQVDLMFSAVMKKRVANGQSLLEYAEFLDLVRSYCTAGDKMVKAGIRTETDVRKLFLENSFKIYGMAKYNAAIATGRVAEEGLVEKLVGIGADRKEATELLLLKLPAIYGENVYEVAKAALKIAGAGISIRGKIEELLLEKLPQEHGTNAYVAAITAGKIAEEGLVEKLVGTGADRKVATDLLFLNLPEIYGENAYDVATAALKIAKAGVSIRVIEELFLIKLPEEHGNTAYGAAIAAGKIAEEGFVGKLVETSMHRERATDLFLLKLPEIYGKHAFTAARLADTLYTGGITLEEVESVLLVTLPEDHGKAHEYVRALVRLMNPGLRISDFKRYYEQCFALCQELWIPDQQILIQITTSVSISEKKKKDPGTADEVLEDIKKILNVCAGSESKTLDSLAGLSKLIEEYPSAWDEFIKPIVFRQTVGSFLFFYAVKRIYDLGGIQSENDLQFLKDFILRHGINAYDLLWNFIVKGLRQGVIQKPIHQAKDSIEEYLAKIPYPIIEIYAEYVKDPKLVDQYKSRCDEIFKAISEGDAARVDSDPFFSAILMYVFPPEVTTQRKEYENLYRMREDRPNDTAKVPQTLQNKSFDVSRGSYVLKDVSKPLDETPWGTILTVVREINKETRPAMTDDEIAAIGKAILGAWGKSEVYAKREEILKGLYRYMRFNLGQTLPDRLTTIEEIMKLKQFVGDTIRDLVSACIDKHKVKDTAAYKAVIGKKFKTKIDNPKGIAAAIEGILTRFAGYPDEARRRISGVLKIDDEEAFKDVWDAVKDKKNKGEIAKVLEGVTFAVREGKEASIIAGQLQGGEYKAMQGEVSSKYEFKGSQEKMRLRLVVSKRKAHGVVGHNMGACVAEDEQLWSNPDFMNVILWDENGRAWGGMHILIVEDNGKRYLTLPGINPHTSLLSQVPADALFDRMMTYAHELAAALKCEKVLIPTRGDILSNRSEIQRVISAKGFKTYPLSREHQFSYSPFNYTFGECYDVPPPASEAVAAKIESFQVKAPYYSVDSMKDGAAVKFANAGEAKAFGERLVAAGRADKFTQVEVLGRKFDMIIEKGSGVTDAMAKAMISEAVNRTKAAGGDINKLPSTLVFGILDTSSHLFEDHIANGFIGINRALYEIKDDNVRALLLQVGLFHEICHEVTGQAGDAFEKAQMERDALLMSELMTAPGIDANIVIPILRKLFEPKVELFINAILNGLTHRSGSPALLAIKQPAKYVVISKATGAIVDTLSRIPAEYLAALDQVIIKSRLDRNGILSLGSRHWMGNGSLPGADVEIEIEKGLVTEVRVLDKGGKVKDILKMARIYDKNTNELKDVFYEALSPARMKKFDQVVIRGCRLDKDGLLTLGSRQWMKNGSHPGADIEIEMEKGLVTEVRVLDKEGNMKEALKMARIYDKKTNELKDVFYDRLLSARMKKLDQVVIKGWYFTERGLLNLGDRSNWMANKQYSDPDKKIEIEIEIEKGLVTEVRVLDKEGKVKDILKMARIYDKKTNELKDVFYQKLSPPRMKNLDQVVIKGCSFDKNGVLSLGRRPRIWMANESYPGEDIEIEIEKGLVTEVRVLDKEGKVKDTLKMVRIYDKKTNELKDVFYSDLPPPRMKNLDQVVIKGRSFNKDGVLSIGHRKWMSNGSYPSAEIEIEIEKGEVSLVKIVKDKAGNPVNSRAGKGVGPVKRFLLSRELSFLNYLSGKILENLKGRLPEDKALEYALLSAETLVRLRDGSLAILKDAGILEETDLEILRDVDPDRLDKSGIVARVCEEIMNFEKSNIESAIVKRNLSTHFMPLKEIQRLLRTYQLGGELGYLSSALAFPDVEKLLKVYGEARAKRGTLDEAKHLSRYDPAKSPVLLPDAQERFRKRIESLVDLLMMLWDRTGKTDVTLQKQIAALQNVQKNIEMGRKTGHPVIDKLFGFAALTKSVSKVTVPSGTFFNKDIPYDKDREPPGDRAQETAVNLAMGPTEVELIEGPPGTGKTMTMEEIIRQYIKQGKKVLVVSHDHKAVNNAIEKLNKEKYTVPLLRLCNEHDPKALFKKLGTLKDWPGNVRLWRTPYAELSPEEQSMQRKCKAALAKFKMAQVKTPGCVVAATNMGIATDWYFQNEWHEGKFDVVIMDEASRETMGGVLVQLHYLKDDGKVIFVGDTKQLPPFGFTDEEEKYLRAELVARGMSEQEANEQIAQAGDGIFEFLLARGRGDRVMLSTNHRSHPLIAMLVSKLFYGGTINVRGWEDFKKETLSLNVIDIAGRGRPKDGYERRVGTSFANDRSAEEVMKLVEKYRLQGILLKDITLITPYSAQVNLLTQKLKDAYPGVKELPRVSTIDSFQGDQSRAVIIDFVRSNNLEKEKRIGFLKDLRRLNVALSRAEDRLAIVWDKETVTGKPGPNDTPLDLAARNKLNEIQEFWNKEIEPFFDPEDLEEEFEMEEPTWPAKADYMQVKTPYYSVDSMKDGKAVKFANADEAKMFGEELVATGRAEKFEQVEVLGRKFDIIIEKGSGVSDAMVKALISEAINRTKAAGGDISKLPSTLVFGILDKSTHLFEDHIANGFIGINRALYEIKDDNVRALLLQVGLFHEMCHEVTGLSGDEFEAAQLRRDAYFAFQLMLKAKIGIEKLEPALHQLLEPAVSSFVRPVKYSGLKNKYLSDARPIGAKNGIDQTLLVLHNAYEETAGVICDTSVWENMSPEEVEIQLNAVELAVNRGVEIIAAIAGDDRNKGRVEQRLAALEKAGKIKIVRGARTEMPQAVESAVALYPEDTKFSLMVASRYAGSYGYLAARLIALILSDEKEEVYVDKETIAALDLKGVSEGKVPLNTLPSRNLPEKLNDMIGSIEVTLFHA